jgi:hypothetical protein
VLSDLDYRERGGYSRELISVQRPATRPGASPTTLTAVAYVGTCVISERVHLRLRLRDVPFRSGRIDNPNFLLVTEDKATEVIARAVGPSGSNSEYLFNLCNYIR